ncbi:hypothetical protein V6C53_06210 [Desulfocurvibacter africanus]|uniref:hypothetical protein n=1 Tax=Desulfocurvibacter africanus TaxID=873 RepID=UPI002FD97581
MCSTHRPTLKATLDNLRQPMPLREKLRLIARNFSLRFSKRQACCGHPGQPGC